MGLAEDSQADVDRNVDEGLVTAAGGRGLVTLGLAKSSNTAVDGDVDQTIRAALLVALGLAEDSSTETNGDVDQAVGGVNTLYIQLVSQRFQLQSPVQVRTVAEAARATRVGIECFILSKVT